MVLGGGDGFVSNPDIKYIHLLFSCLLFPEVANRQKAGRAVCKNT